MAEAGTVFHLLGLSGNYLTLVVMTFDIIFLFLVIMVDGP
jgi:hypothetical protein